VYFTEHHNVNAPTIREEEVEAMGLEEDLDEDGGQDSEEEDKEGHEDGTGLYDEGWG
jgi:hypothetical protein